MICSFFEFDHNVKKFWKPVFMRLIHISITNIYILCKKYSNSKILLYHKTNKTIILKIIEKLLTKYKWKNFGDTFEYQNFFLLTYPENKRRCKESKKNNKRTVTCFDCRLCLTENGKEFTCYENCFTKNLEQHII